jgi:D-alanyl-D-alanine carboxypeptidase (penicillin-binding protein 5/6)
VPSRRQIYRRRRIVVFGGLLLVLSLLFYLPMTLLAPLRAADAVVPEHIETPGAAAALAFPGYGASAIGAVGFPGVLASDGDPAPLPMASITKVVTALTVLQAHPLGVDEAGPAVTMTAADVGYYAESLARNGTVAAVRAGQVYTERELLDLTLIKSANNYSTSLAVWAFGSMDAYLEAARAWVAAHALPSVIITDATGLDPGNVATASDLVELGRLALADPVVRTIVGTTSVALHDVGEDFGSYDTAWGQSAEAEAGAEAVLLTWSDTPVTVEVETEPVRIAEAGETVGSATFTAGVRTVTVPLVLSVAITDPGPGWRLTHPGELF